MKKIIAVILVIALLAGAAAYWIFFKNNINASGHSFINIPTGSDMKGVMAILEERHILQDVWSFELTAKAKGYKTVKPGHYVFTKTMSNREIVNMLASGKQVPVKLVIYNIRTKEEFAGLVGRTLEIDSVAFLVRLNDPAFCAQYDLDTNNILCHFLTDNYEFKWNTNADDFVKRMDGYYKKFWTAERLDTVSMRGSYTPTQLTILASIVEKECTFDKELVTVAGVYFNRLKCDMPLQADPTLVFATRDFNARVVTGYHKEFESPYNTYLHSGLPPGPICMPKKKSIEAVLNAEQNDYIYFCANPDMSGYSVFSKTLLEQNRIAVQYRKKLKELKIK